MEVLKIHSLWNVSISIVAVQFNGRRCLLQSNVLINRLIISRNKKAKVFIWLFISMSVMALDWQYIQVRVTVVPGQTVT